MRRFSPLVVSWLIAWSPSALAQTALHTLDGAVGYHFGQSVSDAGDINGDGFGDIIIGAPDASPNGAKSGTAVVISGADGSTLMTIEGEMVLDRLGHSVSAAGDVDGDGVPDVIVGVIGDDDNGDNSGSARVHSGANGSQLYIFRGNSQFDGFGWSVGKAGDYNNDGFGDVIVGAPNEAGGGAAYVYSGADGSLLDTLFVGFFHTGTSVAGIGDVNGDNHDDVIVGARYADSATVFSGADGSILHEFNAPDTQLGFSVDGAGDVNGDGTPDVIVGAPSFNGLGVERGSATVYSGLDWSVLHEFVGAQDESWFGSSVSGAGDVDGDGFADVVAGNFENDLIGIRGFAKVYSGATGAVLLDLEGEYLGDRFGWSVSSAGDVDGDGRSDVVISAPDFDEGNPVDFDWGRVVVVRLDTALGTNYCTPAIANSTGVPAEISAIGSELVSGNNVTLHATSLPQNQFGYFLASQGQDFIANPGGSAGNLCLANPLGRFAALIASSGPEGSLSISVDLADIPLLGPVGIGETWNFQCWFRDVGGTNNFSDAASILFQ